jgi:uncharacterized protein (TIGR03083 family)
MAVAVDRFGGLEPGPEVVGAALQLQRERLLALFRQLTPEQWQAPSRCSEWTVHEVARHLVDAANLDGARLRGEPPAENDGRIDPRSDPQRWLEASRGQTPGDTIGAFEAAAGAEQTALRRRVTDGSNDQVGGPYGPLHWAMLAAHVLWDAWLHERDILLPLGLPHEAPAAEARLAALYGLAISSTVPTLFGSTLAVTIELTGSANGFYVIDAREEDTRVRFATEGTADVQADTSALLDSLAGRGDDLVDVAHGSDDALTAFTILRDVMLPAT